MSRSTAMSGYVRVSLPVGRGLELILCLLAAGSDLRVAADVKIHRCEIIELVQSTTKSLLAVPFHVAISDFHHQTRDASF